MPNFKWPLLIAAFYFGYKALMELAYLFGLAAGWFSLFWMLFFLACTVACVLAGRKVAGSMLSANGQTGGWLAQYPNMRYSHHAYKSGIALDDQKRVIHLLEGKISKSYSYDEVRSWNTNIQTGGTVYGGGFAGAIGTIESGMNNMKNTGLFITVKDVEHPAWRISLCKPNHRDARRIHANWMEIMQQSLNQDAPAELQSTQFPPSRPANMLRPEAAPAILSSSQLTEPAGRCFCAECGLPNVTSSKFCKSCGHKL